MVNSYPNRTITKTLRFYLLHSSPLTEDQGHSDALQGRLGVEVEEEQLAQRLSRSDVL